MSVLRLQSIQVTVFFGLLIAVTGVFLWMLGKYLYPVFWAIVFTVIFYPLFEYISRQFGERRGAASLFTIILIVLLVLGPCLWVGSLVVRESLQMYQIVNNGQSQSFSILYHSDWMAEHLAPYGIDAEMIANRLQTWSSAILQWLSQSALTFSQVTFTFVVHSAIMVYLLFFLFRDGPYLHQKLITYLPLGDEYERRLITRFTETTRAVVLGTLTIAAIQGIIGGVALWIAGVPAALLWGVAMMLLAIIPAVGPALIWVPASIYLLLQGPLWAGIMVFVVGALLVSVIDEFLRPTLVGRKSKMPDALVLLATIGGLSSFGISGLVVGPVLAAFFLALWSMFEEQYHYQDATVVTSTKPSPKTKKRPERRNSVSAKK